MTDPNSFVSLEENEITEIMIMYRCTEELAREFVRYRKGTWNGDVVTIDELNGREEQIFSEPLLTKEN